MQKRELTKLMDKSIKEVAERIMTCNDEEIDKVAYSMKVLVETSLQI